MKRIVLSGVLMALAVSPAISQVSISLTFTALFEGNHQPLDSVYVMNLTRGGDTTLSGNDTVLLLQEYSGIPGQIAQIGELRLLQNYPNPFTDQTTVSLFLQKEERLTFRVFDAYGREHLRQSGLYIPGEHHFAFYPGREHHYLLSVESRTQRRVIKMMHLGSSGNAKCDLVHQGLQALNISPRLLLVSGFTWMPGDTLRLVAYGTHSANIILHDIMDDPPTQSKLYTMHFIHGLPCIVDPVVFDKDGNAYRTIRIGSKCWMRENMRTTRTFSHSNNDIPLVTDPLTWMNTTTAARCWYNNDSATYAAIYGALYNFRAAGLSRFCPGGWDQPTNDDYLEMFNTLGGVTTAGGKLKSTGTTYWNSPNTGATNQSGFSALPGGIRDATTGGFTSIGNIGAFWTSTSHSTTEGKTNGVFHSTALVINGVNHKNFGYSVRCIRDLSPVADFNADKSTPYIRDTVFFTDLSTGNPTSWLWDFGDGTTSTLQHPYRRYQLPGSYTVKLIVNNPYGQDSMVKPAYINTIKIYDIDGNPYDGVRIGSQYWLRQNLRTTRLYDGTTIPLAAGVTSWVNATIPVRCYYANDSAAYAVTYGALYNWKTVETAKLCPSGWHVPEQYEWNTLVNYCGGASTAGAYLKEAGTAHWAPPNTGANNATSFTALPGGMRDQTGSFIEMGDYGLWWTKTSATPTSSKIFVLSQSSSANLIASAPIIHGLSIRCIRD